MFKKIINLFAAKQGSNARAFRAQEIWWCSLPNGTQAPVLVFRKFNSDTFWGLPLSARTNGTDAPLYMLASLQGKNQALLSRMRTIESRSLVRRVGKISSRQFGVLNAKVVDLLQATTPTPSSRVSKRVHVRSVNPRTFIKQRSDSTFYPRVIPTILPALSVRAR